MKQIELVGVKRLLYRIDDYVHLIVSVKFGYLVPGSYPATVALFKVTRSPWCVIMMNRHTPFLSVYSGAEH